MTDDARRRVAPMMLDLLRQIPVLERDAKRLPIVGRMIGAGMRAAGHVASVRGELERAYLDGASGEELERRLGARRDLAAAELEELRAAIDSWPKRERPVRVVARVLPKATR
jgi:hypothetical protein